MNNVNNTSNLNQYCCVSNLSQYYPEVMGEVIGKMSDEKLPTVALVCKLWSELSKPHIKEALHRYLEKRLPDFIIEAFGGVEKIATFPVLEVKTTGFTDYIDFIKVNMMTAPIMRGIDPANRPFFSVKYSAKILMGTEHLNVATIFQRSAGYMDLWVGCGHANPSTFFDSSEGLLKYDWLKDLVEGKEVSAKKHGKDFILKLV